MFLQYYVTESATGNRVNIEIDAATQADLDATRNGWQTVWNTDFILDPQKEKYAAKTEDGEIIALGAYRVRKGSVAVYIAYIESQPESNPTLTEHKKYSGIGKAMIAFGYTAFDDAAAMASWCLKQRPMIWNSTISVILVHDQSHLCIQMARKPL